MAEVHIVTSDNGQVESVHWDEESAWNRIETLTDDPDNATAWFVDVYQVKGELPRYIR